MRVIRSAGRLGVVLLFLTLTGVAEARTVRKAGPIRYVLSEANVAPGDNVSVFAPCPQGTRVVGGGFGASGALGAGVPTSSLPYDGLADPDLDRDDGWFVNTYNASAAAVKVQGAGVCVRPALGANDLDYTVIDFDVPSFTATSFYQRVCLDGRVTGGGAFLGGGLPATKKIIVSGPVASLGGNHRPDGWYLRVTNTGPTTNGAHLICQRSSALAFRYPRKEAVVYAGEKKRLVARCPNKKGWRVLGGGIHGFFVETQRSLPWDGKDKDKAPDDGWVVRAGSPFTGNKPVVASVHAICVKKK